MKKLTKKHIKEFQDIVHTYFNMYGRDLPWRRTDNPYHVLVSEIMLQQTQVDRVIEKYKAFLKEFPTIQDLALAALREVLSAWQGLGYNRRAKFLHEAAKKIVSNHGGTVPKDITKLEKLPGVGPATARSIATFAFNQPVIFIETNVRSVYIHHFFTGKKEISDKEIFSVVEQTLNTDNPRAWYNALMDYGAHLKKKHTNPSRRSKHHTKQSAFKGSDRQIRGKILRFALAHPHASQKELIKKAGPSAKRTKQVFIKLKEEKLLPT